MMDSAVLNYATPSIFQRLNNCVQILYTKIFWRLERNGFLMHETEAAFQVTGGFFYTRLVNDISKMPEKFLETQAILLGKKNFSATLNLNKVIN